MARGELSGDWRDHGQAFGVFDAERADHPGDQLQVRLAETMTLSLQPGQIAIVGPGGIVGDRVIDVRR